MPTQKELPTHVAIILDGNGRWAKQRGLKRSQGHRAGGEALDKILDYAMEFSIPYISLYAFSTENWKRPKEEVRALWSLMNEFFSERMERCLASGIKVITSGDLSPVPKKNQSIIEEVTSKTAKNTKLTANFCLNYGSQDEILHAANELARERVALALKGERRKANLPIKKKEFEKHLYTHPLPMVDLLVRPGGEYRLSNFLLWQCAYAEFYVTDVLWPDFSKDELNAALAWYANRERRFGGIAEV